MNSQLYEAWLKYLFDHDEAQGDWRFDIEYNSELEGNAQQVIAFTKQMFDTEAAKVGMIQ